MATSAANKKNKKAKRKAVSLQDFLGVNGSDAKTGIVQVTKAIASSWADEIEEDDEYDRPLQTFSLPTAPRASRSLDDVPEDPPYIAHLCNLPFDVEDEDIYELFADQEVEKLRVPREDGGERSRGFGYIEFKTRNDLIAALTLPDPNIRNRRIRIDISNDADQKRGGRGGRYDGGEMSNWRRGDGGGEGEDGGGRRNNYSSSGVTRDWSSNADEEGGNWRQSLKVKSDSPPPIRRSNFDRDGDRGGFDRERGGDRDRYRDREGSDRPLTRSNIVESDRPLTRSNIVESDRPLTRSNIVESDRPIARSNIITEPIVAAERPKLNLQKRTLPLPEIMVAPEEDEATEAEEQSAKPPSRPEPKSVPAVDIFGEAKPVDTAARDRAIEERLESIRLAAEKERLEREAAKAEAAAAAAAEKAKLAAEAEPVVVNGDADAKEKDQPAAPAVNNWRLKTEDHSTNGNGDAAPRTQSPSRRRFSPDRRGGPRRIDDRRGNNDRDFNRRGDNQREITRGDNNNRDNRGRNDNFTRAGRDDRPIRRNENNRTVETSSGDDKPAHVKKEPAEPRLPKYQPPPTNPKLETTNKFEFLDDEGSD